MATMQSLIENKASQISEAIKIGEAALHKDSQKQFTSILLVGMGGSGIGGRIISQVFRDELKVPFITHNGYGVPAFVNDTTLVIASSYSGNTEETINAVEEINQIGAEIVVITSGGRLLEKAKANGWNHYVVPGGEQPRAMLAYSVVQQVFLLWRYGLIAEFSLKSLKQLPAFVEENDSESRKKAKEVAESCKGRTPILYAGDKFEGVATRFRQQINENSKMLCWHHALPEMTHNELVGWAGGNKDFAVIFLNSNLNNPKTTDRWKFVHGKIESIANSVDIIEGKGRDLLTQTFYLIHLTDWVSFYLSEMNNVDPSEVEIIHELKAYMGE